MLTVCTNNGEFDDAVLGDGGFWDGRLGNNPYLVVVGKYVKL